METISRLLNQVTGIVISDFFTSNFTVADASINVQLKSFIAKRVISILVNLRYLRFKLLKYKENNKKICNTFDHNFKNIPLYNIMSNVSLERYYFVLYDGAFTLKMSKMALNAFCDKTLQLLMLLTCIHILAKTFVVYSVLVKMHTHSLTTCPPPKKKKKKKYNNKYNQTFSISSFQIIVNKSDYALGL